MASQLRLNLTRKILDSLRLDAGNPQLISRVSSLLELDKHRTDPELYLSVRDLKQFKSDIDSQTLLKIEKTTELEGVKLKIKPPKNEKIVFKLNRNKFIEEVFSGIKLPYLPKAENKIVEFSSPNIAKPFHVGHLRSTIIGNFVANLFQYLGHRTTRLNYLGDWGTQFGYLNLGVELKGFTEEQIRERPIERLYEAYVAANAAGETDSEVHEKAKAIFTELENGSFTDLARWDLYRKFTVEELSQLYGRLGVTFDEYHWESMYGRRHVEDVLKRLDDERVLHSEKDGRRVALVGERRVPVVKSDGSTLYLTRDIAAFMDRFMRFNFDEAVYVVDNGQNDHFTALFSIMKQLKLPYADRGTHIKFGRIKGMSTRKGTVVFLKDILDEAKEIMWEKQQQSATTKIDLSAMDDASTDILGMSAVIINDLKQRRQSHYDFSWDNALQVNGDTGVKLQYTHCRLCSLEENSGTVAADCINPELITEHDALILIIELGKFPEALARAYETHEACVIVNYLFSLSNATNRALNSLRIKQEPNEDLQRQRQLLFNTTRQTLKAGMKILGLKPLTRM